MLRNLVDLHYILGRLAEVPSDPPRAMTLEQAIAYIDDDEMVEVTPQNIRLRKAFLDLHERKRQKRKAEA